MACRGFKKQTVNCRMARNLAYAVLAALALGIIVGLVFNAAFGNAGDAGTETMKSIAYYLSVIADILLRLIKMIIAPLVFSTLVGGIAAYGRYGSFGYFMPTLYAAIGVLWCCLIAICAK